MVNIVNGSQTLERLKQMRDNLSVCCGFTLKEEGGFVNDPKDPGGATNHGVTERELSLARKARVTIADVKALSIEEAASIAEHLYWNPAGCDVLEPGVDAMALDIAFNMGVGRVRGFLMRTQHLTGVARINALHGLRIGFWRHLPIWARFGRGWNSRETRCHAFAINLSLRKA